MPDQIQPYDPGASMRGLTFTQSVTGHVHSPWFSYDYSHDLGPDGRMVYGFGFGKYEQVSHAAKSAFAHALGIHYLSGVYITQRDNKALQQLEWRVSTHSPCEVPKPYQPKLPAGDAIDVVATPVRPALK